MATSREALADVLTDLGLKGAAAVEAGGSVPSDAVDAIRREVVDLAARLELPSAPPRQGEGCRRPVRRAPGAADARRVWEESRRPRAPNRALARKDAGRVHAARSQREARERALPSPAAPPASGTAPVPVAPRILDASKADRGHARSRQQGPEGRLPLASADAAARSTSRSSPSSGRKRAPRPRPKSNRTRPSARRRAEPAHVSVDTLLAAGPRRSTRPRRG